MKRIVPATFIIAAIFFAATAYRYFTQKDTQPESTEPAPFRTIVPLQANTRLSSAEQNDALTFSAMDEFPQKIPLTSSEIPIQYLQFDFNQDGTDDVIVAVKKIGETALFIIPFELNPLQQEYTRLEIIPTPIINAETFSFYELDVTGERIMSVICTGVSPGNQQTLQIYQPQLTDGGTIFCKIGDFTADGAITIKRTERSEAYSLGQTSGESFPVYTQSADPDAPQSLDQIERIYRWNRTNFRFELFSETKIPGKNVEARYIQQLRQGSVTDFEAFLNGLWYKPDSTKNGTTQYLQVSRDEREIIFFSNNIQEVYRWEVSSPTRLGLYMVTNNKSVSNLRRLVDVKLSGIDEVSVRIMEDVKMKITVDSNWNGTYKKLGNTAGPDADGKEKTTAIPANLLTGPENAAWKTADGLMLDIKNSSYAFSGKQFESGRVSYIILQNTGILRFRSYSGTESNAYIYSTEKTAAEPAGAPEQEILTLIPVTCTAKSFELTGGNGLIFTR